MLGFLQIFTDDVWRHADVIVAPLNTTARAPQIATATRRDLLERGWRTLGQVLAHPVDEELFGRLTRPLLASVFEAPLVKWR